MGITSSSGNRIEWLDLRQHEQDLRVQDEIGGVDVNFTKKWGFVNRDGNVAFEEVSKEVLPFGGGVEFPKDKDSTLSFALDTTFPKDCSIARLLSANDF